MMKKYVYEIAGKMVEVKAESMEAAEAMLKAQGVSRYYLLTTVPVSGMDNALELIRSLKAETEYGYERVLQEADEKEVAYQDGILQGIGLCLSTLQGAADRENIGEG